MSMRLRSACSLTAMLIAIAIVPARASAKDACEKKCFEAQTCPIVGDKCLKFNWCRDECPAADEAGSDHRADPAEPKAPASPLPGPKEI